MQRRPLPPAHLQTCRELARKSVDNSDASIVELTLAAALLEAINEIERLSEIRPAAEIPHGFICGSCGAAPPRCCADSCVRLKRELFYGDECNAQKREAT